MELSLPDVPFGMGGDVRAAAHAGEPCRHRAAPARSLSANSSMTLGKATRPRAREFSRMSARCARLGRQKAPGVVIKDPSESRWINPPCGVISFRNV
jgi:hypothetical protein